MNVTSADSAMTYRQFTLLLVLSGCKSFLPFCSLPSLLPLLFPCSYPAVKRPMNFGETLGKQWFLSKNAFLCVINVTRLLMCHDSSF